MDYTTKSLAVSPTIEDILTNQEVQTTPRHTLKEALRLSPVVEAILENQEMVNKNIPEELRQAEAQVTRWKEVLSHLWKCEYGELRRVEVQLSKWTNIVTQLQHKNDCKMPTKVKYKNKHLEQAYPQKLNKDVLKWRNNEGWPSLGLFSMQTSILVFSSRVRSFGQRELLYNKTADYREHKENPYNIKHLVDTFGEYYEDVLDRTDTEILRHDSANRVTVSCSFSGLIPDSAKLAIKEAQKSKFFSEIYLLAETPKWDVSFINDPVTTTRINHDPIALGWDGKDLRVITVFDTTSLEELALNS